jgi:hypothetical protein
LNASNEPNLAANVEERRKHSRCYVAGVAVVSRPNHVGSDACLVRNLSVGGAMLLSSPPLPVGERCRVALTAPGLMGEEFSARIVRSGTATDGASWAAVEFHELSLGALERLERLVSLELSRAAAPAVLVVDSNAWKLAYITEQLAQHSRRTLLANTPLTAANWLVERSNEIALALVGVRMGSSVADELLALLAQRYPTIHRALFDEPFSGASMRRLLDRVEAEDPRHDPWLPNEIERARAGR